MALSEARRQTMQVMSISTYQKAKTLLRNNQKRQWKRATGDYNPSTDPINSLARRADHYIQVANRPLRPASTPEAIWHHGLCTLRLQRSRTDGPPHPPGLSHLAETDTSYGRRMSQPPTSCGEQRKTCTTPPNSWQHVD